MSYIYICLVYVETDGVNCVTMTFNLASPIAQKWSVKVAQIESGMIWEAPQGKSLIKLNRKDINMSSSCFSTKL